jgi:hypothetical protein
MLLDADTILPDAKFAISSLDINFQEILAIAKNGSRGLVNGSDGTLCYRCYQYFTNGN